MADSGRKGRPKRPLEDPLEDSDDEIPWRENALRKHAIENAPLFPVITLYHDATAVKSHAVVAPLQGGSLVATAAKSAVSSINVAGPADREKVRVRDQRVGSWKLVYLECIHGLKYVPVKLEGTGAVRADQEKWEDSEEEPFPENDAVPFSDPFHYEGQMYPEFRRWEEEAIRLKKIQGGGRRMGQAKMEITSLSQKRKGKPLVLFTLFPANDILVLAGLTRTLKISSRGGLVIWK
jgi:hypothetical protein